MPLRKVPYTGIGILIKKNLDIQEHEGTKQLISELRLAKKRGYLVKPELVKICKWKSPRAIHLITSNSEMSIKKLTSEAFITRSEKRKIELLTTLKGVSLPMASSILTLLNPKRYGVMDIRVWEILYQIGTTTSNSRGIHFKFEEWHRYLIIIRHFAKKFNVSARDIERTLFRVHQEYQEGNLYDKLVKTQKAGSN